MRSVITELARGWSGKGRVLWGDKYDGGKEQGEVGVDGLVVAAGHGGLDDQDVVKGEDTADQFIWTLALLTTIPCTSVLTTRLVDLWRVMKLHFCACLALVGVTSSSIILLPTAGRALSLPVPRRACCAVAVPPLCRRRPSTACVPGYSRQGTVTRCVAHNSRRDRRRRGDTAPRGASQLCRQGPQTRLLRTGPRH